MKIIWATSCFTKYPGLLREEEVDQLQNDDDKDDNESYYDNGDDGDDDDNDDDDDDNDDGDDGNAQVPLDADLQSSTAKA